MIDIAAINIELNSARKGSKSDIVNRFANIYDVSAGTIYRELRKSYGPKKEVKRDNKIDQTIIDEIAKIKTEGFNGVSDRELATDIAIDICKMRGIKVPDNLQVSTVNRRLREAGWREKTPYRRIEAEYANQQHQMDFSRSKYFQLVGYDDKANDYLLKATSKSLAYKENENSLRTWCVGITDSYSRISITKVFAATGESSLIGIELMNFAYNRAEDEHPLMYLPEILKTDNGAFIKDHSVKAMLEALGIKSELTVPYQKHGIQKRESAWKMLWQRFELKQYIVMGENSKLYMNEFNDLLHEFMIELLEFKHPLKAETRGHVYLASLASHPAKETDFDFKSVAFKVDYRIVNQALQISLNNKIFECPQFALDKQIRIYKNRQNEVVGELVNGFHKPFILKPTEGYSNIGDFHNSFEQTYAQQITKDLKADKEKAKNEKSKAEESKIRYLKPRVQKVKDNTIFSEVLEDENYSFKDNYAAKVYIGKQLLNNETYEDYSEVFDPMFKAGELKKTSIDAVLFHIKNKIIAL